MRARETPGALPYHAVTQVWHIDLSSTGRKDHEETNPSATQTSQAADPPVSAACLVAGLSNQDAARANLIFERYLVAWMEACPEKLKEVIAQLIEAFANDASPSLATDNRRAAPAQLVDASARSLSNQSGRK